MPDATGIWEEDEKEFKKLGPSASDILVDLVENEDDEDSEIFY